MLEIERTMGEQLLSTVYLFSPSAVFLHAFRLNEILLTFMCVAKSIWQST